MAASFAKATDHGGRIDFVVPVFPQTEGGVVAGIDGLVRRKR